MAENIVARTFDEWTYAIEKAANGGYDSRWWGIATYIGSWFRPVYDQEEES